MVYFRVQFQHLLKMRDKFEPRESVCQSPFEFASLPPGYQPGSLILGEGARLWRPREKSNRGTAGLLRCYALLTSEYLPSDTTYRLGRPESSAVPL